MLRKTLFIAVLMSSSISIANAAVKYAPNDIRVNHISNITYQQEAPDSTFYNFEKTIDFGSFKLTKTRIYPLDKGLLKLVQSDRYFKSKLLSSGTHDFVTLNLNTQFGPVELTYEQNVPVARVKVTNKNDIFTYVDYTAARRKQVTNSIYGMDTIKFLTERAMALNPKTTRIFSGKDETKIRDDIQLILDEKFPGVYNIITVKAF